MASNKIPVSIITGFLGSGKTTLLNHIIQIHSDKKFAIIENEFGDIPIDQELVVNTEEGIFEMANGCICCSLNTELGQLLAKLIKGNYQFDHLLIETTGIAEPDSIAAAFMGPGREKKFQLDGTICLADAKDITSNLEERGEAVKQISFADLIVLNKTDLVSNAQLVFAKDIIRKYNKDAIIEETDHGRVNTDQLLHLKAYDGVKLESLLTNVSHDHHHHDNLTAHSFEFDQPFNPQKFEHWINALITFSGSQLYRIKGIISLEGETHKVIFQSVRNESKIELGSKWEQNENKKSVITFIGYGVQRENIEKGLKSCLV